MDTPTEIDGVKQECCGNCVFFMPTSVTEVPQIGPDGKVAETITGVPAGFCRRFPPTPILIYQRAVRPNTIIGRPDEPSNEPPQPSIQPTYTTTHGLQWCGEYTAVEEYENFKAVRNGTAELIETDDADAP